MEKTDIKHVNVSAAFNVNVEKHQYIPLMCSFMAPPAGVHIHPSADGRGHVDLDCDEWSVGLEFLRLRCAAV